MLPYRLVVLLGSGSDALGLNLRCIIYQECLKLKRFREQKVANIVPAYRDMVQSDCLSALDSQLHGLEMSVHRYVHTYIVNTSCLTSDSANDNSAILELDSDCLIIELHQKAYKLHYYLMI